MDSKTDDDERFFSTVYESISYSTTTTFPTCYLESIWAHLPAQPSHKILIAVSASTVAEDGDLVLLAWGHIQYCHFIGGTAEGEGNNNSTLYSHILAYSHL